MGTEIVKAMDASATLAPIFAQHAGSIYPTHGGPRISRETIQAIRVELVSALATTTEPRHARAAAAKLVASYPNGKPLDFKVYLQGLADELSRYAPDVVAAAVIQVRRTVKFLPSIAEVVEACERFTFERRSGLWDCDKALREIEARDRAKREREEAERKNREHTDALVAFVSKHVRGAAGEGASIAHAYRAVWRLCGYSEGKALDSMIQADDGRGAKLLHSVADMIKRNEPDRAIKRAWRDVIGVAAS